MTIITPEQTAAYRVLYMHGLTLAFLGGNSARWYSASDAERAEVRLSIKRAGIAAPAAEPKRLVYKAPKRERKSKAVAVKA